MIAHIILAKSPKFINAQMAVLLGEPPENKRRRTALVASELLVAKHPPSTATAAAKDVVRGPLPRSPWLQLPSFAHLQSGPAWLPWGRLHAPLGLVLDVPTAGQTQSHQNELAIQVAGMGIPCGTGHELESSEAGMTSLNVSDADRSQPSSHTQHCDRL